MNHLLLFRLKEATVFRLCLATNNIYILDLPKVCLAGLEPATPILRVSCYYHLSYKHIVLFLCFKLKANIFSQLISELIIKFGASAYLNAASKSITVSHRALYSGSITPSDTPLFIRKSFCLSKNVSRSLYVNGLFIYFCNSDISFSDIVPDLLIVIKYW